MYETNPAPSTGSSGTLSSKQQAPLPPRDLAFQGVTSRRHPAISTQTRQPLVLIGLSNLSLARDTRVTRVTGVCGKGEGQGLGGEECLTVISMWSVAQR